jgi:hypothetical protein
MTTPAEGGPLGSGGQAGTVTHAWGPMGSRSRATSLRPELPVAIVVTLGLTWVVTLTLFLTADDRPDDYLGGRYLPQAAMLVLVVAPVALLFSRGEYDLSLIGTAPLGLYLYAEVADGNVLAGLLVSAGVGLAIGAAVGVLRLLTRAPSALLTIATGFVVQAIAYKLTLHLDGASPGGIGFLVGSTDSQLGGSGWLVTTALVAVAFAVSLAVLPGWGAAGQRPGPTIVAGYALSACAASTAAAFLLAVPSHEENVVVGGEQWLPMLTAIAVAGAVVARGLVGPLAGAGAALAVALLADIPLLREWDDGFVDRNLLLAGTFAVCLLVTYGLRRILVPATDPGTLAATGPLPPPGPPPPSGGRAGPLGRATETSASPEPPTASAAPLAPSAAPPIYPTAPPLAPPSGPGGT